jgi:DNA-directed RNA polymerase subunit alpha
VLITQRPTLSEEPISDTRSKFTIEPLEPGFGYTLGNSLRRTLLSSIPGAAVTSIKVDGVLHEFTTIPGVKEDVVERGRGYVSSVQNKGGDNEIGRMPVDSIYSPVLKVTYKVEATRVEQRTDFDKLVIDVETKPSIRPRDAIASAGKTLVELFGLARELNVEAEGIDIGPSPVDEQLAQDLAMPVEDLNLTVRSYNCLKREGIHTVGELISRSEQDLLDIRNFGAKSIDEVKAKLAEMGLSLKDSAPGFDPHAALAAYTDDDYDDAYVEDEQL